MALGKVSVIGREIKKIYTGVANKKASAMLTLNSAAGGRVAVAITTDNLPDEPLSQIILSAGTGAQQRFGVATAMSPDGLYLAAAGQFSTTAAASPVRVYRRVNNTWSLFSTIQTNAIAGFVNGAFHSLAISNGGTWLAVGNELNSNAVNAVQTYELTDAVAGTYTARTRLTSTASTGFGTSVSINAAGDQLAIGAPFFTNTNGSAGRVEFATRSGTTWTLSATKFTPTATANSYVGQCVVLTDAGIVFASDSANSLGYSVVFNTSTALQSFTAPSVLGFSPSLICYNGRLISASRDARVVAFGSPVASGFNGQFGGVGVALVFAGSITATPATTSSYRWSFMASLASPTPVGSGFFGAALAVSPNGRKIVVAEPGANGDNFAQTNSGGQPGALHVFSRVGNSYRHIDRILNTNPAQGLSYAQGLSPQSNYGFFGEAPQVYSDFNRMDVVAGFSTVNDPAAAETGQIQKVSYPLLESTILDFDLTPRSSVDKSGLVIDAGESVYLIGRSENAWANALLAGYSEKAPT